MDKKNKEISFTLLDNADFEKIKQFARKKGQTVSGLARNSLYREVFGE
jgi:hypothetical protein